ncbi:MAG: ArsR family transcriptional regulator [Terracidiphilus sp.]
MARAATTSDAFNAIAEPRRREILSYLALRERPVGDIVATLRLDQPSVSKHLRCEALAWSVYVVKVATNSTEPTPRPFAHCTNGPLRLSVIGSINCSA